MAKPAELLDINTLSNVHVIEELIQLPVGSDLLSYLAITTCYRSWPQLICGTIQHELLQFGANFGYPALIHP